MTWTGVVAVTRRAKAESGIMVLPLVLTAEPLETPPPLLVAIALVAALLADELVLEAVSLVLELVTVPEVALVEAVPLADSPEVLT